MYKNLCCLPIFFPLGYSSFSYWIFKAPLHVKNIHLLTYLRQIIFLVCVLILLSIRFLKPGRISEELKVNSFLLKVGELGTSLAVQWLRLWASTAGDVGFIPGWGNKIPQAESCDQEKESKKTKVKILKIKFLSAFQMAHWLGHRSCLEPGTLGSRCQELTVFPPATHQYWLYKAALCFPMASFVLIWPF